ncbi:hypothetical protein SUNI508_06848 [Seiridium unicorne]|uniref:Uncharacterized protein n=1 Tax=Seiridium unicorne TaxID=138068 RepID=A0ABR2V0H2_9PEZI
MRNLSSWQARQEDLSLTNQQNTIMSGDRDPQSTNEVVQRSQRVFQHQPSLPSASHEPRLTEQSAEVVQIYQHGIGTCMDVLDDSLTYQRQIIIKDEGRECTLRDEVFLVTSASSGISIETSRAVVATGAKVFLAVRELEKVGAACKSFLEPGRVELIELDLAANYLSHFLLFWLLKDALIKSSTPEFQSRLVNVSSSGHQASEIIWGDFKMQDYNPLTAYGQSKLAQIYMANYVDRHFGSQGIHALSVMPGGIIETGLAKYTPKEVMDGFKTHPVVSKWVKDPEQGAATWDFRLASSGKEDRYTHEVLCTILCI